MIGVRSLRHRGERLVLVASTRGGRVLLAGMLSVVALGCSPCGDVQKYPAGTTINVTVPQAYAGCHVTFAGGAEYTVVAGPPFKELKPNGPECEINAAVAPPEFTTTEYIFSNCGYGHNDGPLSTFCQATVPDCLNPELTEIRIFYDTVPRSPGEKVNTRLHLDYSALDTECPMQGCAVDIPVTMSW